MQSWLAKLWFTDQANKQFAYHNCGQVTRWAKRFLISNIWFQRSKPKKTSSHIWLDVSVHLVPAHWQTQLIELLELGIYSQNWWKLQLKVVFACKELCAGTVYWFPWPLLSSNTLVASSRFWTRKTPTQITSIREMPSKVVLSSTSNPNFFRLRVLFIALLSSSCFFSRSNAFMLSKNRFGRSLPYQSATSKQSTRLRMVLIPPASMNGSFASPRPPQVDGVVIGKIIIDEFVLVSLLEKHHEIHACRKYCTCLECSCQIFKTAKMSQTFWILTIARVVSNHGISNVCYSCMKRHGWHTAAYYSTVLRAITACRHVLHMPELRCSQRGRGISMHMLKFLELVFESVWRGCSRSKWCDHIAICRTCIACMFVLVHIWIYTWMHHILCAPWWMHEHAYSISTRAHTLCIYTCTRWMRGCIIPVHTYTHVCAHIRIHTSLLRHKQYLACGYCAFNTVLTSIRLRARTHAHARHTHAWKNARTHAHT